MTREFTSFIYLIDCTIENKDKEILSILSEFSITSLIPYGFLIEFSTYFSGKICNSI